VGTRPVVRRERQQYAAARRPRAQHHRGHSVARRRSACIAANVPKHAENGTRGVDRIPALALSGHTGSTFSISARIISVAFHACRTRSLAVRGNRGRPQICYTNHPNRRSNMYRSVYIAMVLILATSLPGCESMKSMTGSAPDLTGLLTKQLGV